MKRGLNIVLLLSAVFLGLAFTITNNTTVPKTLSVKEMKDDFKIFRSSLEEGHPGLYRYTSKDKMDKLFDSVEKSITAPMTDIEFFVKLRPLLAAVCCGHTGLNFSKEANDEIYGKPFIFPFALKFLNGKAYMFKNLSDDTSLKMGGEIISINGNKINDIINKMLPMISADGHIVTSKYRYLERINPFSLYYRLLYGETDNFTVKYFSYPDRIEKSLTVKGILYGDANKIEKERYPGNKSSDAVTFEYVDGIPVLTIRTFGSDKANKDYSFKDYLKFVFTELDKKKEKNLIIDMRNNGGGDDDYGKTLAAYLLDKPFDYYKYLEIKKNSFDFADYTTSPDRFKKIADSSIRKNSRGWYDWLDHPNVGKQKPLQPVFKGKTFILLNGGSFSATGETTSIIHYHKKAKFIGEECGAGYYGNNSGFTAQMVLPNSKLSFRIPLWKYTMAVDGYPSDRGLIPDYPVAPKLEDLLEERDTEMNYAINLIKKQK